MGKTSIMLTLINPSHQCPQVLEQIIFKKVCFKHFSLAPLHQIGGDDRNEI